MGRLNQLQVKSAKPGRHGDGDGLYLLVSPTGAKSWVLRIQSDGQRRDIGLGAADTASRIGTDKSALQDVPLLQRRRLSLAEAREKAGVLRSLAKTGRDPIAERDKDRTKVPTFEEATVATHAALKGGWESRNAAAFLATLKEHAYPALGSMRVDAVDASHIRDMLEPIWLTTPVMARKVRQRVSTVLNFAKSKGWRVHEAPGKSVTVGLPNQPAGGNFRAMPYAEVPAFFADITGQADTMGRLALQLAILAPARPGEVRHARWKHVDLERKTWDRPGDLMKNKLPHTVTLNAAAVALLKRLRDARSPKPDDLLFPGKLGRPMSDMTLTAALKTAKQPYDVHGFRSSFRDWAAERMPHIPDPVAESAIAHIVPDKVVRAYKRTQFLEMRRELVDAWGAFVAEGST